MPNPPRDARLTDDEREALRLAWRGPWGDDMVPSAPPRLVDTVERIIAARAEDELIAEIARQGQEITRLRLEVATGDNRIAAALAVCDQVRSQPRSGPVVVSLARTIREALTRPIPPGGDDDA